MRILLLFLLLALSSCGADDEDLVQLAIESANSYLTNGNCQSAIDDLEAVGRHTKNAAYVKTLASAYACRGGYSTQTLFETDITKVGTPSLLGGFATFTTSTTMDDPQNQAYLDIQEAIDILLYAGGIDASLDPTITRRALSFSSDDAGDINALIMYLTMVQMGKYLYFYGNADSSGEKGAGVSGNGCLANYNTGGPLALDTILSNLPAGNSCKGNVGDVPGSNYLGTTLGELNAERMCQVIVLFNNFAHVFPSVIASIGGDSFSSFATFETDINVAKNAMITLHPPVVEISTVKSQTKCEDLSEVDGNSNNLEVYFAAIIETLFE